MNWLDDQANVYRDMFGAINPEQLPVLQAHFNGVMAVKQRLLDAMKTADARRAATAGLVRKA